MRRWRENCMSAAARPRGFARAGRGGFDRPAPSSRLEVPRLAGRIWSRSPRRAVRWKCWRSELARERVSMEDIDRLRFLKQELLTAFRAEGWSLRDAGPGLPLAGLGVERNPGSRPPYVGCRCRTSSMWAFSTWDAGPFSGVMDAMHQRYIDYLRGAPQNRPRTAVGFHLSLGAPDMESQPGREG